MIGHEGFDFGRRGGQPDQVEAHAPGERGAIGLGLRRHLRAANPANTIRSMASCGSTPSDERRRRPAELRPARSAAATNAPGTWLPRRSTAAAWRSPPRQSTQLGRVRRHRFVGIVAGDATEQFAFVGLAGNDRPIARFQFLQGQVANIEPQPGFALVDVGAVAGEALVGEDRAARRG